MKYLSPFRATFAVALATGATCFTPHSVPTLRLRAAARNRMVSPPSGHMLNDTTRRQLIRSNAAKNIEGSSSDKALVFPVGGSALGNALAIGIFVSVVGYFVLTVDSDVWRGWNLSEVLVRLPVDNWRAYMTSLRELPVLTKTEINVFIYLFGDYRGQF